MTKSPAAPLVAILTAIAIAIAVVVIVNAAGLFPPDVGDPGGRILQTIAPFAAQVERAAGVHVRWVNDLPWPPPANFASEQDSAQDSCDGRAGTFGWDPVIVEMGVQWSGSGTQFIARITKEFGRHGFTKVGQIPAWDTDGGGVRGAAWIRRDPKVGPIVLTLTNPGSIIPSLPTTNHQWMAMLQAKPTKPPPKGC